METADKTDIASNLPTRSTTARRQCAKQDNAGTDAMCSDMIQAQPCGGQRHDTAACHCSAYTCALQPSIDPDCH